jgi:hypothetical protein
MEFGMLLAVARQWHDGMYTQMRDADSVQTQLSGGARRVLVERQVVQCARHRSISCCFDCFEAEVTMKRVWARADAGDLKRKKHDACAVQRHKLKTEYRLSSDLYNIYI